MYGNFSPKAIEAFTKAVGEENFSEGLFDFTTCERSDGSLYGTSGHCRKGTQTETKVKTTSGRFRSEMAARSKDDDVVSPSRTRAKAAIKGKAKSPADLATPQKQGKADVDRIKKYLQDESDKLKNLNDAQKQNPGRSNDPDVASRKKILERNVAAANKQLKDLEGKP
jgi:hypothetical protein